MYITYEDAKQDLPAVIKKYGSWDKHYQPVPMPYSSSLKACMYVDYEGNPSCLVGCYLVEIGVPVEFLEEDRTASFEGLTIPDFEFSYEAHSALIKLQELQDSDVAWGTAYEITFEPTKENTE